MPCLNQAEFLQPAIRSVLDQGYDNLEFIIIDGGSTDGSVDIIRKFSNRLAYWVSEPDNGQAQAINKGLRRATGEWIAWQNSDDLFLPGAFHGLASASHRYPRAMLLTGNMLLIDQSGQPLREMRYVRPTYSILRAEGMVVTNQAAFWKRETHSSIGYLDETFECAFDYDWFLRLTESFPAEHVRALWGALRIYGETKSKKRADVFAAEMERIRARRPFPDWAKSFYRMRRALRMIAQGDAPYVLRGLIRRVREPST